MGQSTAINVGHSENVRTSLKDWMTRRTVRRESISRRITNHPIPQPSANKTATAEIAMWRAYFFILRERAGEGFGEDGGHDLLFSDNGFAAFGGVRGCSRFVT